MVDVKLVHNDDDGEDERRVHTRLHHHMEYAFVDDNILQWRLSCHLRIQAKRFTTSSSQDFSTYLCALIVYRCGWRLSKHATQDDGSIHAKHSQWKGRPHIAWAQPQACKSGGSRSKNLDPFQGNGQFLWIDMQGQGYNLYS